MTCILCGNKVIELYKLGSYEIMQCISCKTSFVKDMPSYEVLSDFYSGFLFHADLEHLKNVLTPEVKEWFASLNLPQNARMLDVGGGGGFFPKAFEEFGFGEGYYIDLDTEACKFAEQKLGLKHVQNANIEHLTVTTDTKYDLVYSRHVIEHLADPRALIDRSLDFLAPGGIFVLHCPNGLSLEHIGYPGALKWKIKTLIQSNKEINWFNIASYLTSNKFTHGLYPIRHLWAFSEKGLLAYLGNKKDLSISVKTAPRNSKLWSPYYQAKTRAHALYLKLVNATFGKISGGCHLIITIKKEK